MPGRRSLLAMIFRRGKRAATTAEELWARVQAAEEDHGTALGESDAFGVIDPGRDGSPQYEAAYRAAGLAWVRAEEARHDLDQFLHPRRYARKGHRAEALDRFRRRAGAGPEIEAGA